MKKMQMDFELRMDEEQLLNCMRCGFCLPHCPTYIETQDEAASPRGRIALMKAVTDGLIEPDEDVENHLNLCLGCRACEPVCPSNVKYGHLLEEARDIINKHKKHSLPAKVARNVTFKKLFPQQKRMKKMTGLLSFYQRSGLQKAARKTGMLKFLPTQLQHMEKILPIVPGYKMMKERPTHVSAIGVTKKKVAFFTGCLMDTMFLETNEATIKLLQLAGCEISIPEPQACCGALHGHSGEKETAKEMAKRNIKAFEQLDVDAVITNAGGCGAFLHDYDELFKNDEEWAERAQQFTSKLQDLSSLLIELDFLKKPLSLPEQVVTYQDSCHLRNVMRVSTEPRKLLQAIDGISYKEMNNADHCCGSAGIYNILEPEMSTKILERKMKHVKETNAVTIVTSNPGCLLQMKLGVENEGLADSIRVVHIADLLLEAVEPFVLIKP